MKRTTIILGLLALSMLIGFMTVSAQEGVTTTITRAANIRAAPDADSDSRGIAAVGTTILLDGRNENGNWVRGITAGGTIGWVSSGTVGITLSDLHNLPIITADTPFLLSAPAQAAPASSQPPATGSPSDGGGYDPNGLTVMATANVNLRSGPSTEYRRVGGLYAGQPLTIDGRDTTANWVRGINPEGVVGWAYTAYVDIAQDTLLNLPAVSVDAPFTLRAPGGTPAMTVPVEVVAAPPVAPVVNTAPVTGFSYGGHVDAFSDHAVNMMHYAGMTWVKRQFRYHDGHPPESAAGWIDEAHGRGFRIVLGVVGWNPHDLNSPGYYERFASFVGGVAALGADAIEVWNEPNIEHEWPAGQINPAQYTELLRQSYHAIKSANPNTLVISAAPAPTGYYGGCSGHGCDDNLYVEGMARAGAANVMDCMGIHYNEGILPPTATSGDPRGNSSHYTRYFQSMMNVYYNAFGGARPLCFTELGYLSPEGFGPLSPQFGWAGDITVAQQAAWLDQAISMARNSGRVRLVIIWNVDFVHYGTDPMAGYAVIRPDGRCPACDALAH